MLLRQLDIASLKTDESLGELSQFIKVYGFGASLIAYNIGPAHVYRSVYTQSVLICRTIAAS